VLPGFRPLRLDLYQPPGAPGSHPLVVFIPRRRLDVGTHATFRRLRGLPGVLASLAGERIRGSPRWSIGSAAKPRFRRPSRTSKRRSAGCALARLNMASIGRRGRLGRLGGRTTRGSRSNELRCGRTAACDRAATERRARERPSGGSEGIPQRGRRRLQRPAAAQCPGPKTANRIASRV